MERTEKGLNALLLYGPSQSYTTDSTPHSRSPQISLDLSVPLTPSAVLSRASKVTLLSEVCQISLFIISHLTQVRTSRDLFMTSQ